MLTKLIEGEKAMKISQLIGLGEEQRKIYRCIISHGRMRGNLKRSYEYHQKELELLIKYQLRMRKWQGIVDLNAKIIYY